ncbi:hypothetical protein FOZ63_004130, partial [Perkinsus olseni]
SRSIVPFRPKIPVGAIWRGALWHFLVTSTLSDDDSCSYDCGWIAWYCSLKGHEMFAEVDEDYIRDAFNLYGLRAKVQFYDHALEMILSDERPDEEDLADNDFLEIYREAVDLYGLIHARYCLTPRGLSVVKEKYLRGDYGTCPRVYCNGQHVLPTGRVGEELRVEPVKLYCPKCEQLYVPRQKHAHLDGAYFGASLPSLFFQTFPKLIPAEVPVYFEPRVFGFKVHNRPSVVLKKLQNDVAKGASYIDFQGCSNAAGPYPFPIDPSDDHLLSEEEE